MDLEKEIKDADFRNRQREEDDERGRNYSWHKVWKQLRSFNGAYNIDGFNLQNDRLDRNNDHEHYDLKIWKYQFRNR